ncbi:Glycerol kinase [Wickerhamomyces ciferrii]|uniref:glycerol kinase n=1 Tax=Wickerhamomyces ciferrii (strain ATCC 14091 / BCRC 22168 / CBS 111 / JCM 3599 / NBRC 0793 / NRRL Y-1031 F-60-10) TaxID=1206466 RepID=K0KUW4_WICCF|nr:Glycerol kinase [Wickerhamomyces ciferrii]CCH44953.1 Glycerol kinase [Wickerhamomyces ciferrii]
MPVVKDNELIPSVSKVLKDSRLIGAIDIGTTSTRCILFNSRGEIVAMHQIAYPSSTNQSETLSKIKIDPTLIYPKPSWVEMNPNNLILYVIICIAECQKQLNKINDQRRKIGQLELYIATIGIANMRETVILWDQRNGKAVYNGIVWSDGRTSEMIEELKKKTPKSKLKKLRSKCGLDLSSYFSASKIKWLLENDSKVQDVYDSGDLMFGTVDSWLVYHLTKNNQHKTDVSNASRTLFMDLNKCQYDEELIEFWGIDSKKLKFPEICSSSELFGHFQIPNLNSLKSSSIKISNEDLNALKIIQDSNVPINGVLGDQSSSLVGQLCLKKGDAKCTYGTGGFLMLNTGSKPLITKKGVLPTVGFWLKNINNKEDSTPFYALEGAISSAGSSIEWIKNTFNIIPTAKDIGALAATVKDSGGTSFVSGFTGLLSPHWDPDARGSLQGLSNYTKPGHIARSSLEGISFQVHDILKVMAIVNGAHKSFMNDEDENYEDSVKQDDSNAISMLAIDGGVSKSEEFVQIQSDIFGPWVKLCKPPVSEATALGVAIAAGFGFENDEEKIWKSFDEVTECLNFKNNLKIYESKSTREERIANFKNWKQAIYNTLCPESKLKILTKEQLIEMAKKCMKLVKEKEAEEKEDQEESSDSEEADESNEEKTLIDNDSDSIELIEEDFLIRIKLD